MSCLPFMLLLAAAAWSQTALPEASVVYVAAGDLTDPLNVQTRVLRDGQLVLSTQIRDACRVALLKAPAFLAFSPQGQSCRGLSSPPVAVTDTLTVLEPPPLVSVQVVPASATGVFEDGFEAQNNGGSIP